MQFDARATESGRHRAFADAGTSYGFHEHGFTTGLHAATSLPGVTLPFRISDTDVECGVPRRAWCPTCLTCLVPYGRVLLSLLLVEERRIGVGGTVILSLLYWNL